MKLSWHSIVQALLVVIQVGNVVSLATQTTNPKTSMAVATFVGVLQFILHQYGYYQFPPSGPTSSNQSLKFIAFIIFAMLLVPMVKGQTSTAPAPLPGYQVTLTAGYSLVSGAQNSNSAYSSIALPIRTFDKTNSFSISGRGDYFYITNPVSAYVLAGKPEFRFQFSRASFFNGKVFQPFFGPSLGAAKSTCTSCPSKYYAAEGFYGGLDMVESTSMTWRLIEVDYFHSKLFPNNQTVESNIPAILTALSIKF